MKEKIKISIPMPLIISVEDVGWWSGRDGSAFNQPYRTAMPRDHVPEDYAALAALGKGLDMRILSGFVLCEWDRKNILRQVPTSTWMGKKWTVQKNNNEQKEMAAQIINSERKYLEFGLHGIGHEFWTDGKMERAEFHNSNCEMRDRDEIRKHINFFFKLMDQYKFNFKIRTFIPPALKHSFGNGDKGFQRILNEFGIKYVTLIFNRAKLFSLPQTDKIAWENNVLLVERKEADIKWNIVAAMPKFKFDRPVLALHWANILHANPEKNMLVVDKWINYIKENSRKHGFLLAKDSKACFTQYLHKTMSEIKKNNTEISIDVSWIKKIPCNLVGDLLFLKLLSYDNTKFKISGADLQPAVRSFEMDFLKLKIHKQTETILIKPCD